MLFSLSSAIFILYPKNMKKSLSREKFIFIILYNAKVIGTLIVNKTALPSTPKAKRSINGLFKGKYYQTILYLDMTENY